MTFSEDDEIINPEDVDPSVGRFRNMVQTAVVPVKKKRVEGPGSLGLEETGSRRMQNFAFSGGLYGGLPPRTVKPAPSHTASTGQHSSVACLCHIQTSLLTWT